MHTDNKHTLSYTSYKEIQETLLYNGPVKSILVNHNKDDSFYELVNFLYYNIHLAPENILIDAKLDKSLFQYASFYLDGLCKITKI